MTLTTYASPSEPSDITTLNLSRLFARLEHNLLSSSADLKPLRRSEHQRMRVGANIEYARTSLQSLERSLPQIKPLDRRNDLQTDLAQKRQVLKRLQNVLDELAAEAAPRPTRRADDAAAGINNAYAEEEEEEDSLDGEDLLGTLEDGSTTDGIEEEVEVEETNDRNLVSDEGERATSATATTLHSLAPPTTTTTEVPPPVATPTPTSSPSSSTLRNRSNVPSTSPLATATGASIHDSPSSPEHPPSPSNSQLQNTEDALSSDRAEQENLTSSLLALATQLKTSSQAFHSSLESEKSVLARAADGLDRTTSNMQAAERRMGMLRRMSEGKGWWGRMMLYAWIFGLWLVAILIVFLGPKLRF
ncbi:hypothetical protein BO71DRAFT_371011 [Aspergillus ellipticus CBS 707.79]|uniref:Synaptobrevin n=1 Tax=Aspergillus ellipticus CBS 707.79 TaxID=1448320 RepID=A0A319F1Q2_9EURO|nr:hypothetical protein BO71DRAFT_371011 [Aspergillus ellipticus CBS 707.79]